MQQEVQVSFAPDAQATSHAVTRGLGYRYQSSDDKWVVQFRLDGMTVSRLAPYTTWEELFAEAQRMWGVYSHVALPEGVSRVATRFINNLRLPMRDGDPFEAFLTAAPQVPSGLPQSLMAFLQRVVVYSADLEASAIITQYWQPGADTASERVPVILDIDAYREASFPSDGSEIWDYLTRLRTFKNQVFFESLTDKAVALYE